MKAARAGRVSELVTVDPGYSPCHCNTYTGVFPECFSSCMMGHRDLWAVLTLL